jgi:hypothetical protein
MGSFLKGLERQASFTHPNKELSLTTLTTACIEPGTISDLLLASLVEWLGERYLAPITNNSIRRNKDMILNGISEVSKETGIHPSSLRRWEALGFMAPGRISFGETWVRVYTDEEVELLKTVKRLIDEGYRVRPAFERASGRIEQRTRDMDE